MVMKFAYKYIFILLIAGIYSCTYDKIDPDNKIEPECKLPDTVSFKQHIVPILVNNCSLSDCHSGVNPEGNLNLEESVAYSQLMNPQDGYVDTLDPEGSLLYSSLISQSNPMPPDGMDDCKKKMILKWMQQKAKNN